jgi:hypothetical protein
MIFQKDFVNFLQSKNFFFQSFKNSKALSKHKLGRW